VSGLMIWVSCDLIVSVVNAFDVEENDKYKAHNET